MFGTNPELLALMLSQQLAAILTGKAPEGFKITEQSETRVCLEPLEIPDLSSSGIVLGRVHVSLTYHGVEIILTANA